MCKGDGSSKKKRWRELTMVIHGGTFQSILPSQERNRVQKLDPHLTVGGQGGMVIRVLMTVLDYADKSLRFNLHITAPAVIVY